MDVSTGNVKAMAEFEKELGKEAFDEKVANGQIVPVDEGLMTFAQQQRLQTNNQPVIRPEDQRSKLAVIRNQDRNKPCFCGSGKKYKKCHMRLDIISNYNLCKAHGLAPR